jgi:hypothetical protein
MLALRVVIGAGGRRRGYEQEERPHRYRCHCCFSKSSNQSLSPLFPLAGDWKSHRLANSIGHGMILRLSGVRRELERFYGSLGMGAIGSILYGLSLRRVACGLGSKSHGVADRNFNNMLICYREHTSHTPESSRMTARDEIDRLLRACWRERRPAYVEPPADVAERQDTSDPETARSQPAIQRSGATRPRNFANLQMSFTSRSSCNSSRR